MSKLIQLVVAGVGLVGRRHIAAMKQCDGLELLGVIDPDNKVESYAKHLNTPWYQSLAEMFSQVKPDGVILSTPNQLHLENGLECIAAKCPVLIEKPLATSAKEGEILVEAARRDGVPMLVGHHRRHNPLIQKAHELINKGEIGNIKSVHGNCWIYKPDSYFDDNPWRKKAGAGPISVNLVHDIDLIRHLCGDVVSVQAKKSESSRGYENEDVAVAILQFENGALGTITVSDVIVSPWSWELTANENPAYPPTAESCYLIGGTHGSLSLPDLTLWKNGVKRGWWEAISATTVPRDSSDPLINQINQFKAVILGKEPPLVSGEEGMKTLKVIEAIHQSSETNKTITI